MVLVPVLAMVRVMQTAENATNYSIDNTARQIIWLPTTAEMKYRTKPAIDALFVRLGDGMAALTILVGVQMLDLSTRTLFVLNVVLVTGWLTAALVIVREHRRWTEHGPPLSP